MPVREIGGISRANLAGAVHLSRQGNTLLAALNVNQAVPRATVRILAGDREIFRDNVDLSPPRTWSHQLENAEPQQKYTFELRDAKGSVLLRQTEGEYDWTPAEQIRVGPQPAYKVPDPEHRTEDDWIQLGNQQELDGQLLIALQTYKDALARFPESFELRKAAGRLCASLLRFEEAKDYLEPVRARDTTDAEASYYLGIANEGLGQVREARESFEAAALLPAFRAAAGLRLAELSAREGDLKKAESYLRSVMRSAPDDLRAAEELSATLSAEGQKDESRKLANDWLDQYPERSFLLEQVGKPDLQHLSNDAQRVLNIASEYMRLGMYAQALEVLSRKYPDAVADESEPGVLPPDKHPMLAYYRAFCREKLDQSANADLSAAAKLATDYVFPSRATDLEVLRAALRINPEDATAHYLLGTLYFSRGLTEPALAEWEQARRINPQIPVLHGSLGRALLQTKDNPEQALAVFQEGLRSDPQNVELYTGIDQALSILQRPPKDRVQALERYPDSANMPSDLVYELILNLAESGGFDKSVALFHNRFFPRAEGGTNVRQIWVEVQVQHAISLAQSGNCSLATNIVDNLAEPVPDLAFTRDGLQPFLRSARFSYLIGSIYKICGQTDKATRAFERAAEQSGLENAVWSVKASEQLPNFDQNAATEKLQNILSRARNNGESGDHSSWWLYNIAMLETALGEDDRAQKEFRQALLAPDQFMAYHLTRLALSSNH